MTNYHHYKLRCKTLSPVHIGNGDTLASIGDYYTSSNRLFIIDQEKLDKCIDPVDNKEFFDQYMTEIKENVSLSKSDFSIVPFLNDHGISLDVITSESEMPILTANYKSQKNSQLKLAARQNKLLYFPGSSIKGAIKTALFYHYLSINPDILKNWLEIIENNTERKFYLKDWTANIERDFYQFFKGEKSDYNLLRIEDTTSFSAEDKGVWETGRFHLYKSNDDMVNWLCEGIKADTSFDLSITILPEFSFDFLSFLNKSEISSLLALINKFSRAQLELEIKEIKASNLTPTAKQIILDQLNGLLQFTGNNQQALLRLGAGKSFFYITVCSLLDRAHFERLRSIVGIGKKDESIFPLSRTFTTDYESYGWVLLELPKEQEVELPLNEASEIVKNETLLKAVVIDYKKVAINLNGTVVETQLVLTIQQKATPPVKGAVLEVYVKELSKDGRIIMVGIK